MQGILAIVLQNLSATQQDHPPLSCQLQLPLHLRELLYFEPWFKKTFATQSLAIPCLGMLCMARYDDLFKDVKNRPKLIETTDATADQFWALPGEVERVRAQDALGAEAFSKKHRLHPAVGYARIKPRDRPTWDGSAAQVYDEAKQAEASDAVESGSSSSDEDSEGDDEALVSNARRAGQASEHATKKRRRCVRAVESAVDTKEEVHTVLAVFGEGTDGPEVWLGLKVQCRTRNKTRIQFLEVVEGDEGD